jgi:glyoxylase-like metal-dependent hydrolase (beta-lactamase superfamily II)
MSGQLVKIPLITKINQSVIRILGSNPGPFTLQGTNTYLVGKGPKRTLIDTGAGEDEYLETLKQVLNDEKCTIDRILITHHHYDHVGGIDQVLSLSGEKLKIYKIPYPEEDPENNSYITINKGQVFEVDQNLNLLALITPGHCRDHICLVLKEEGILFSGDMILGQGTAVFDNLSDYMKSLDLVKNYPSSQFKLILPGHGPELKEPASVVQEYIDHRNEREAQILKILAKKSDVPDRPRLWSSKGIVGVIYEGYPKGVLMAAEHVVDLHLEKLLVDVKVIKIEKEDIIYWELKSKRSNL